MSRWLAILRPPDMQRGAAPELDLRPFEIVDFDRAETMAVRDQDQRSVAMRVAAFPSGLDELFDFGGRQILPRPELYVARPGRLAGAPCANSLIFR